ncbi:MAG: glutamate--tRNA ligase [Deltaproteobacteria bacterium]|nr:glutamate--tRNA ligase [Deltaproteobacteria bacterium]
MARTRFAPSPTGYLHIGGVRTALFCWLFSRHHRGQFLLRIDDTDQERNVAAALAPILHGLRWLGIDWDEGPEVGGPHEPYFQSERKARHQEAARALLQRGVAYRDYARPEELAAERAEAEREKRPYLYSRRWKASTDAEARAFEAEGRTAVVRLAMPREGHLRLQDLVRGEVSFPWSNEQDHVIQRADGSCLYHLASVVDDHDFGITHVIRAEEHLSNTPRQVFLAQGLGYALPAYAHLPYVAEPGSKQKLSKRKLDRYLKNKDFAAVHEHGQGIARALGLATAAETFNPVIVDFYEQVGYLPEALVNYLLLLGWSLDGHTEYLSREEMVEHFSLERVHPGPASFDPKKLHAFQLHYMQRLTLDERAARTLPYLLRAGLAREDTASVRAQLRRVVEVLGDRLKVFGDIVGYPEYFDDDYHHKKHDEAAFAKRLGTPEDRARLGRLREHLAGGTDFDAASIERCLQAFVEAEGIALGDVIHGVRLAVTGATTGPGLYDCLAVVGREKTLQRIDRVLGGERASPLAV